MTDTVNRAKGILLIAWGISFLLGSLAPAMRILTGVQGGGRWPIYAAVVVMLLAWYFIRNAESSLYLSLMMSASAIVIGGAVGFLGVGVATGKATALLFAGKWAVLGLMISFAFHRQFKKIGDEPPSFEIGEFPSQEELEMMTREERDRFLEKRISEMEQMSERLKVNTRKTWIQFGVLLLLGLVAVGSSQIIKASMNKNKKEIGIVRSAN